MVSTWVNLHTAAAAWASSGLKKMETRSCVKYVMTRHKVSHTKDQEDLIGAAQPLQARVEETQQDEEREQCARAPLSWI
jgi:hypothetical protein